MYFMNFGARWALRMKEERKNNNPTTKEYQEIVVQRRLNNIWQQGMQKSVVSERQREYKNGFD